MRESSLHHRVHLFNKVEEEEEVEVVNRRRTGTQMKERLKIIEEEEEDGEEEIVVGLGLLADQWIKFVSVQTISTF